MLVKEQYINSTALVPVLIYFYFYFTVSSQTIFLSTSQQLWTSSAASGSVYRLYYSNSEVISAIIAPTGAVSVTLQFNSFNTESNYDFVTVKSCNAIDCSQTSELGKYSGTTIPSPMTSNTGIMQIVWTSDLVTTSTGWSASWSSIRTGVVVWFTYSMLFISNLKLPMHQRNSPCIFNYSLRPCSLR